MITADRNFSEKVIQKAKTLRITPKFLLIAICGAANNLPDSRIVKKYWSELVSDMTNAAKRQVQSKNVRRREAGEEALLQLTANEIREVSKSLTDELGLSNCIATTKPLLKLHPVAIIEILKNYEKLACAARKDGVADLHISGMTRAVCAELIEDVRELSNFFRKDLSFN